MAVISCQYSHVMDKTNSLIPTPEQQQPAPRQLLIRHWFARSTAPQWLSSCCKPNEIRCIRHGISAPFTPPKCQVAKWPGSLSPRYDLRLELRPRVRGDNECFEDGPCKCKQKLERYLRVAFRRRAGDIKGNLASHWSWISTQPQIHHYKLKQTWKTFLVPNRDDYPRRGWYHHLRWR